MRTAQISAPAASGFSSWAEMPMPTALLSSCAEPMTVWKAFVASQYAVAMLPLQVTATYVRLFQEVFEPFGTTQPSFHPSARYWTPWTSGFWLSPRRRSTTRARFSNRPTYAQFSNSFCCGRCETTSSSVNAAPLPESALSTAGEVVVNPLVEPSATYASLANVAFPVLTIVSLPERSVHVAGADSWTPTPAFSMASRCRSRRLASSGRAYCA